MEKKLLTNTTNSLNSALPIETHCTEQIYSFLNCPPLMGARLCGLISVLCAVLMMVLSSSSCWVCHKLHGPRRSKDAAAKMIYDSMSVNLITFYRKN